MDNKYTTGSVIKRVKTGKKLIIHREPIEELKHAGFADNFYECSNPSGLHCLVSKGHIESDQYVLVHTKDNNLNFERV